jgi:hypothetical protein
MIKSSFEKQRLIERETIAIKFKLIGLIRDDVRATSQSCMSFSLDSLGKRLHYRNGMRSTAKRFAAYFGVLTRNRIFLWEFCRQTGRKFH